MAEALRLVHRNSSQHRAKHASGVGPWQIGDPLHDVELGYRTDLVADPIRELFSKRVGRSSVVHQPDERVDALSPCLVRNTDDGCLGHGLVRDETCSMSVGPIRWPETAMMSSIRSVIQ